MKRLLLLLLIVAAVAWVAALPARAPQPPPLAAGIAPPRRGAIHVHTRQSDGTGTAESIAAAAARAGLAFVILTDHGDASRPPARPAYRSGVLVIDAAEVSTEGGHVLALGLPQAPYPLGGEPRDVVDDIARLGGFSIAAHPESAKPDLRWSDWSTPVGGLEWLNGDSEWRDETRLRLARALLTYPGRGAESIGSLLDRPDAALRRWDALTRDRRVVAVAAADAHARIGVRSLGEPYTSRALLPLPSYEAVFRTFSNALAGTTLGGDAAADAAAVLSAIREGQLYSIVDAVGGTAALSFTATSGESTAGIGAALPLNGPVTLRVAAQAPPHARIVLLKDSREVAAADGAALEHQAGAAPGVYRVEVRLPGAPGEPPIPWMLTNPIYVGQPATAAVPPVPPVPQAPGSVAVQYGDGPATGWTVETGARSQGVIDVLASVGGTQLGFRFALSGAQSENPYAALVMPAGPAIGAHDRVTFTARASRPLRISVQLRAPGGAAGERWHRSVVLDTEPREITVAFDDMRPRGATSTPRPVAANVQSLLFVVDPVNNPTGTNGQFVIDDVKYGR